MSLFLLSLALSAHASDVDTFRPAASLSTNLGSLQGEAPQLTEEGFSGGVSLGFVQDPVVRTFDNGLRRSEVSALVPANLHGGWTLEDLARIDLFVPIYPWVDAPINDFQGAALGDLRLQGTIPVWQRADTPLQLAVVPRIELPTGSANAVVAGGFQAGLLASLGAEGETLGWVTNVGTTLAKNDPLEPSAVGLGSTMDLLGGAWWHASPSFRVGGEIDLDVGLASGGVGTNNGGTGQVFAQNTLPNGLGLTVGAGTGLIAGLGSPAFRMFGGVTWAQLNRDADGDGLADAEDACPHEPEDLDGFADLDGCPELDNDEDGVLDAADQCPVEPEDIDDFQDADGCPDPDNDGDTLLDPQDACPNDPGTADMAGCPDTDADGLSDADDACPTEAGPLNTQGCPDTDSDLVPNHRDRCPDEPTPEAEDPATSDGCPKSVYVSGDQIKIMERVEFATGESVLLPVSEPVLQAVANILIANPQVEQLEVQGHTDNVGSPGSNLELSQLRAESVRDWLTQHGVESERLTAKGYGEVKPIASNRTPKGREKNRRVQFLILSTAKAPVERVIEPKVQGLAPGKLTVKIKGGAWATIFIDDQRLTKSAPFAGIEVEAGHHQLRAENFKAGIDWSTEIDVPTKGHLELLVPLAEEAPAARMNPWGEALEPEEEDLGNPWSPAEPEPEDPWGPTELEPEPESPWGEQPAPAPEAAPAPPPEVPAAEEPAKREGRRSKKRR